MSEIIFLGKLSRFIRHLNGSTVEYDCASYLPVLEKVKNKYEVLECASDAELKITAEKLRTRAGAGDDLDALLPDAFGLAAEAIRRTLGLCPFDEQIIAGIVLHSGKCAEMQTGEGKTLAAVFPACLNALTGNGVHVLTFNDYLAARDAEWMGPVYRFLGLSVGNVREGLAIRPRRAAYQSDITYVTAKEAGFDFLRDSLCGSADDIVHRPLNFAIVDEADSILVDEARIPLVIAGAALVEKDADGQLAKMARIACVLERGKDFEFDDYMRNIHLTEDGERRAENILGCGNVYTEDNFGTLSRLGHALDARHLLHPDEDYIVRNNRIELVDEFTGRVADKRRWPDGLQAAVEAKEGISAESNGIILNSITLQHFARLYPKLAGMTATAQAAQEEFRGFYKLNVVVIPPHRPCRRKDLPDKIFSSQEAKLCALVEHIASVHATGRPILVGTRTVRESDSLAVRLKHKNVPCTVLNAKNDAQEAAIVADAGLLDAVTISTNMAGRGTDIKLGGSNGKTRDQVFALGGLYVIGTNKHESVRIDNQLRGRAGRQGDPGSSCFFMSPDDDLFVKYRLRDLLPSRLLSGNDAGIIDNPIVRSEINRVQRIIEGQNTEIKTTLYRYSILLQQQREILFEKRRFILETDNAFVHVKDRDPECAGKLIDRFGKKAAGEQCRAIALACINRHWSRHLAQATDIREGIHLRRMGGQNPLYEFQKLIIAMFNDMEKDIDREFLSLCQRRAENTSDGYSGSGLAAPSATWTYLINDDPFDPMLEVELKGNIGFGAWAGLLWPYTALYFLVRQITRRKARRNVRAAG